MCSFSTVAVGLREPWSFLHLHLYLVGLSLISFFAEHSYPSGAPGPPDQNFLNFMQFLGKSDKFVCWRPPAPQGSCPLIREILDPPLFIDIHIHYSLLRVQPLLHSVNGALNVIKDKMKNNVYGISSFQFTLYYIL